MKIIGQNGSKIIVELDEKDLKNYNIEFDYWKKAIGINLKAAVLQEASKELKEAKYELEQFTKCHSKSFEKIVKAGTLIGVLFEDKSNNLRKNDS